MQRRNDAIVLSASDLMRFQGCEHATTLDLRYLNGEPLVPSEDSPSGKLIQAKGDAHERAFLETLMASEGSVHVIDKGAGAHAFEEAVAATRSTLEAGPDWIYQAALTGDNWGGYADFLERVPRPSKLGDFSYEVIDTKLKRSPDPKHVLQLGLYSDLLMDLQCIAPEHIHIVLGDNRRVSLRLADYRSYVQHLRTRLEDFIDSPTPTRPEPVPACELCRWREHCAQQWDRTDSLCLLPGIRKGQRHKLEAAGVATITSLGAQVAKVPKLADETLAKLRVQARLHSARREGGPPRCELRPFEIEKGLLRLPKPALGDLFFDMEGDPLIEGRLEYLFGIYFEADGIGKFAAFWAHDRAAEREATERVLDFFSTHIRAYPEARIYHYGHYEPTALKRLASGHGVGEAVLDQLLREKRFVDLYRIVEQGLITSEPGSSLKDLEVFYGHERPQDVATAGDSIVAYERWCETGDTNILDEIRAYNEADCRSTKGLYDWLVGTVRPAGLPWWKSTPLASDCSDADERTTRAEEERRELRRQMAKVAGPLAGEPAELMLELAWFHQREDKPRWWAMFDRAERDTGELIDDPDSLGGLVAIDEAITDKKSLVRTYRYPEQETKIREDARVRMKDGIKHVAITHLDPETREIDVKFSPTAGTPPDVLDLIPAGPLDNDVLRDGVRRSAAP